MRISDWSSDVCSSDLPFYLTWKAHEVGVHTRFIELAGEVNNSMPDYVVGKVSLALNRRRKALNGSRILVLGIAYKKNVDDMRESPSVLLMERLEAPGAHIDYSDPYFPSFPQMREHSFTLDRKEARRGGNGWVSTLSPAWSPSP